MQTKINDHVMIRTYSAGVHFGKLVHKEYTPAGTIVILENARRIYSWEGGHTLSDLSTVGSTAIEKCKISMPVPYIELTSIEIIKMTPAACKSLYGSDYWKITSESDEKIDELLKEAL